MLGSPRRRLTSWLRGTETGVERDGGSDGTRARGLRRDSSRLHACSAVGGCGSSLRERPPRTAVQPPVAHSSLIAGGRARRWATEAVAIRVSGPRTSSLSGQGAPRPTLGSAAERIGRCRSAGTFGLARPSSRRPVASSLRRRGRAAHGPAVPRPRRHSEGRRHCRCLGEGRGGPRATCAKLCSPPAPGSAGAATPAAESRHTRGATRGGPGRPALHRLAFMNPPSHNKQNLMKEEP